MFLGGEGTFQVGVIGEDVLPQSVRDGFAGRCVQQFEGASELMLLNGVITLLLAGMIWVR